MTTVKKTAVNPEATDTEEAEDVNQFVAKSSGGDYTSITIRSDLLHELGGLSYRVTEEEDGFSTLQVTWTTYAKILTRLNSLDPGKSKA